MIAVNPYAKKTVTSVFFALMVYTFLPVFTIPSELTFNTGFTQAHASSLNITFIDDDEQVFIRSYLMLCLF